ncbi:PilC/PilY family type IV pilus protein [Desulfoluna sp.]|uniref:PilC/PilY family type IV pilus protein n=1 Tax=Desulfoluna sp. TaxID=2045199 RepID=UPI00261DF175|nr:PilC/PilY family type IV pilus protein [Desulfoluna sp.]
MFIRQIVRLMVLVLLVSCPVMADDTSIYGTQPVTLQPNVLIIFDNSGSMSTQDVPDVIYDPAVVYTGSSTPQGVYYRQRVCSSWWSCRYEWTLLIGDIANMLCQPVKDTLDVSGYAYDYLKSDYSCGGYNKYRLRTGNYINYEASSGVTYRSRMAVAKEVVKELLVDITGVRFGLMVFHTSQGGYVVDDCGTANSTISTHISGLSASTWTPLGETLAEAGLYFAGESGHFNTINYATPIQHRCQKNYVIIITDGEPTKDDDRILYDINYYNNAKIGDYDGDGLELNSDGTVKYPYGNNGTDFLDDVAGFLYNTDMHPMGSGTSFEKQNIITHTIGFKINHDFLSRTAIHGGGSYHTANTASSLKEAFNQIISTIVEESTVFVAPVVPVNRLNRTADGGYLYLAFFKPTQLGEWLGNLKKYGLNESGQITDAFGRLAVNADGSMKDNVRSFWTQLVNDGADVTKGGAGERIQLQSSRNVYTYTGTQASLTHASNRFEVANTAIGVIPDLITEVLDGISGWPIGSVIHSEPAVVHYSATASMIYFGSNDGLFRCVDDASGEELWAFVPPGQLSRLSLLQDNNYDYYVDGQPGVAYGARMTGTDLFEPQTLLVGERRGGTRYYALDISDYNEPKWKYVLTEGLLSGAGNETLGQSWGAPEFCRVRLSVGTEADVFMLPGGYDNQQDLASPAAADTVGRALFAVKVSDGTLAGFNVNAGNWSDLTHSFVDLRVVDHDADGLTTRVYAGDMSGNVFVIADDVVIDTSGLLRKVGTKVPDGTWAYRNQIFEGEGGKMFYAPTVSDIQGGVETLFFGTGNRANPLDATETNRFYAVYNNWLYTKLEASKDLLDVSDVTTVYDEKTLKSTKGWFIDLPNTGEKVVSQALVDSGVVYFTTYTPTGTSTASTTDPCAGTGARGVGRLYAISTLDAQPITDWGASSVGKKRSTQLPSDLPIAVPIIKNRRLYVGAKSWDLPKDDRVDYFYWKQNR